jgi:hypothetical protein
VLERFLDDAFVSAGYDLTIVEGVDLSPCWWYCEYLEVDAWAELNFDPAVTPAVRCERVTDRINRVANAEPRELPDRQDNRSCWRSWDFVSRGRNVSLMLDVSEQSDHAVTIYIANDSATRAFLPQG